ncbi:hypothetical protein [Chitiniphilus shinanonensis]|uniref:hypothetical protein n=1 Tax=Chitiniphilus shinanonensis TaxID=553088 RepID=UPI003042EBD4
MDEVMGGYMNLESIYWHDGRVVSIELHGDGRVLIALDLYLDESSSSRTAMLLTMGEVSNFCCTIDFFQLKDNAAAGNVGDGKICKRQDGLFTLKLVLVDGYVSAMGRKLALAAR